jgi:diguanylate cyclase (GGDEF)-like protein
MNRCTPPHLSKRCIHSIGARALRCLRRACIDSTLNAPELGARRLPNRGFGWTVSRNAIAFLVPVLISTLIFGWAAATLPAQPAVLTTLHAIHSLSNADAGKSLPVAFETTVTYYNPKDVDMFVQDGDEAVYVQAPKGAILVPGDRVLITGHTGVYYRPDVIAASLTLLQHGPVPDPVPATYDQMIRVQRFCMLVKVRGVIQSADMVADGDLHTINMRILMAGGFVDAFVIGDDESVIKDLLDAEVEVNAVVPLNFDNKMQLTGVLLEIPTLGDIKILKRAGVSPWLLPITPMDGILAGYRLQNLSPRVRVQGTITYYQPGSAVVLQSGSKSLWILTQSHNPLRIGDLADALGFPEVHDGFLTLTGGEVKDSLAPASIPPQPATWTDLSSGLYAFDLVSTEGTVVTSVRAAAKDEYVLNVNGQLFSAIYNHPTGVGNLPPLPMKQILPGSTVRVTGICWLHSSDAFHGPVAFDILLRNFEDVTVVANPSLLSVQNLIVLVGLLLALLFAAGSRGWVMERKVRRQKTIQADIEHRRSRILEDINGSRPLAEIVEQITELVSFKLRGAPCWCQIVDGAQLGNCPPNLNALRVIQEQIPARSGVPLGTVYAALDPLAKPRPSEPETLSMAASLTSLAIETRRLYTDLVRRSETDLLTDIHSRFSLDKQLDALIEEAREKAGIFGLIYIDLNNFKLVNDQYGHRAGDMYLQEVALRMKRQLRSGDMVARLGGDEFAALAPRIRSRADAEDVARRLESCFNEPFQIDGAQLHGSASMGIALYPEDGLTKDSLLSTADAAMYVNKHTRRQVVDEIDAQTKPRATSEKRT